MGDMLLTDIQCTKADEIPRAGIQSKSTGCFHSAKYKALTVFYLYEAGVLTLSTLHSDPHHPN